MKTKNILLIPPSGKLKKQDFSLIRIAKWLNEYEYINITLLYIREDNITIPMHDFKNSYELKNEKELFKTIQTLNYDLIFHRTWMGSYYFAAKLIKSFKNVIVNIKDWNFAKKEVYQYLFPNTKDCEGIDYIFKNSKLVLSHFTKEQAKLWAKEYNTSNNKFKFFPEYCNKQNFNKKPIIKYKNIHLVYAGKIPPTSYEEDYFPGKSHLRSIKLLTKQHIKIDFVLPPKIYESFFNSKDLFQDYLYQDRINNNFNIIKGEELKSNILNKYHFGFFELETSGVNHQLYKYAITSKFAFYLECGLPLLVNKDFYSISNLVKKYKLGIVFSNKDLKNLDNKLDISQKEYNTFCKNIEKYRNKFTYKDKHLKEVFNEFI